MKQLTQLFWGLKWHQSIEYIIMMFITLSVPIDWHFGVWGLMALVLSTIVKVVATHRIGNPAINRATKISLLLIMLFYGCYMASTIYSNNPQEAWSTTIITMLPLLLLPIVFLISDMSYLRANHRAALIYLLAGTLTMRFVVMAINAVARHFQGIPFNELIDFHFDPLHHNYLAMYLIAAIALLYTQLSKHWKSDNWRRTRWIVVADMMALAIYMVIMGSRSGLVVLALLALACLVHLAFVKKQWAATGLMVIALGLMIGISYLAAPRLYWRIIYSAQKIASGQQGDSRQMLWKCGLEVLDGHEIIGHGCDGYWDLLHEKYVEHNFAEGFLHEQYNTHNQYLETALATGLIGLAVMLAFMLLPFIASFTHRPRNLPFVLFSLVYAGCIAFEGSFARQMGLMFIFWWYAILLLDLQESSQATEPK